MDTEQLLELLWECRVETAILQAQRSDSRYMKAKALARKELQADSRSHKQKKLKTEFR